MSSINAYCWNFRGYAPGTSLQKSSSPPPSPTLFSPRWQTTWFSGTTENRCPSTWSLSILDVLFSVMLPFIGGKVRTGRLQIKFYFNLNGLRGQCWVMFPNVWPIWITGGTGVARSGPERGITCLRVSFTQQRFAPFLLPSQLCHLLIISFS